MNISTVNELIQSLESAGEISLKEQFYLEYMRESLDKDRRIEQLTAERDALREEGIGTNTKAAADIYFQLVEELGVHPGGSLVQCIDNMRERLAALENYAEAEAVGADRAAEDGVYWMKRCKELESHTVKLPRPGFITISGERMAVYMKGEVVAALLAAGIKVEAE